MKLLRIIDRVCNRPWFIEPAAYSSIVELINNKLAGISPLGDSPSDGKMVDPGSEFPDPNLIDSNGIAVIEVMGVMANRIGMIEKICGGQDYNDLEQAINQAEAAGAKGFLFHFDSPGGSAMGCPEMAQLIADLDAPKVAFTDGQCCSAAYFMASSCDHIVSTSTADLGSIGCICNYFDKSQAAAAAGIKYDPIISENSHYKSAFGGFSMTPEQRAYAQAGVDQMYKMFTDHVSQYRDLDFEALQGGSYMGEKAMSEGLTDQLGNYADAYNKLIGLIGSRSNNPA